MFILPVPLHEEYGDVMQHREHRSQRRCGETLLRSANRRHWAEEAIRPVEPNGYAVCHHHNQTDHRPRI